MRELGRVVALALLVAACRGKPPEHAAALAPSSAPSRPKSSLTASPSASATLPLTPLPLDQALLDAARNHESAFQRDLALLVNTDSGTDDAPGLSQVAAFVAERLRALGGEVDVMPAPPSAGKLVRATLRGTGTRKILLLAHLDTVFSPGEAARRPFRVEGERARGPGVADDKGGVVLVLHALAIARERGFHDYGTLSVLFDPDEEKGSPGSRELIRALSAEHDVVLSFEPPDGERVIVATNGIALVELEVEGRASHAGSAPEQGRNAALELAHQILRLKDLGDAKKGTTLNFTVLHAGDRINVIPDHARATADMRFSDEREVERVERDAERLVAEHLVPETEVRVTVDPRRPAFSRNAASERLAVLARRIELGLGRSLEPVAMRYGTDAGFAYRPGGATPAVLEGLGLPGDGLHTAEEWADLASVGPRLYLTVRLLEALSTGRDD